MAEVKCIHCKEMVFETATECPHCNKPIANPDAPTRVPASPRDWKNVSHRKKNFLPIILAGVAAAGLILYFFLR
jgi:uncharacterized protein with PIN domain